MSARNKKKNHNNVKDPGPGLLLQQARIKKDLSLKDISTRLRLGKDIIDALENDNYDKLPAPIFVRGYIKSYAAIVSIDASQIIAQYNKVVGEVDTSISLGTAHVTSPSMTAIKDRKKKWIPVISAGLLILIGLIIWMFVDTDAPSQAQQSDHSAELQTATATLTPIIKYEMKNELIEQQARSQPLSNTDTVKPLVEPEIEKELEVAPTLTADLVDTGVDEAKQKTIKSELDQLVLIFNGDSWVDVSDATGKRLIYTMLKSGQQRSVSGQPPFKLNLGNAPKINLTRNGETVDLTPYTRGKIAKFRLGKIKE